MDLGRKFERRGRNFDVASTVATFGEVDREFAGEPVVLQLPVIPNAWGLAEIWEIARNRIGWNASLDREINAYPGLIGWRLPERDGRNAIGLDIAPIEDEIVGHAYRGQANGLLEQEQ